MLDERSSGAAAAGVDEPPHSCAFDQAAAPPQTPVPQQAPAREDSAWARSGEWGGTSTSTPLPPVEDDRSSSTVRGQAPGAAGRQKKKAAKRKRRG